MFGLCFHASMVVVWRVSFIDCWRQTASRHATSTSHLFPRPQRRRLRGWPTGSETHWQLPANLGAERTVTGRTVIGKSRQQIATLTYKILSTQQPAYLYNLISYHQPSRVLRFSSQLLLEVPRTKTEFGRRAFSSASPQIWNDISLPIRYSPSLDSFKRHLKTFLFTRP